ncbi:ATP-binding protein [Pseudoflavonifractor intestinihominis]
MSESDIFTLFGNILDNAIEGVERLDDPDDRIIQLNVVGRNSFVQIREENYFRDGLLLSGQTLMTTKEDKEHHGYGMKSIALLVEKYGGHHKIETQENLFALDILLPMRDRQNGER